MTKNKIKKNIASRLVKSKAFVVIEWDGKEDLPRISYDLAFANNPRDVRHRLMEKVASVAMQGLQEIKKFAADQAEKLEQAKRVEEAKEKRSEELRAELV